LPKCDLYFGRKNCKQSLSSLIVPIAGADIGFLTGFRGVCVEFLMCPRWCSLCSIQNAIATSLLAIPFKSFVSPATRYATASVGRAIVRAFLIGWIAGNTAAAGKSNARISAG
jgi:uncharacterized membrane protein YfcA